uniref:Uncharacterized protein n=1 Tax=Florenciella parvula TaxID=236787 RepID=A0A7S2GBH8_9STRA|mmetsp:Transcript_9055/g.19167  ORF Transcript_9055/g.19167 Transcript_9055/m.19167 type:complete len:111 (+) Transcript_9055:2-334(+)
MSLRTRVHLLLVVVASNVLVAVTTTTDNAALSVSLPRMWGRSPGALGRDKSDASTAKHTDSPVGRSRMPEPAQGLLSNIGTPAPELGRIPADFDLQHLDLILKQQLGHEF